MSIKRNRKGNNCAPKRAKAKSGGYPKGGTKAAARARKAIGTGKA